MSSLIVAVRSIEGLTLLADTRWQAAEGLFELLVPSWISRPEFAIGMTGFVGWPGSSYNPGLLAGTFWGLRRLNLTPESLTDFAAALEAHLKAAAPAVLRSVDAKESFTEFLLASVQHDEPQLVTVSLPRDGHARVSWHTDAACIGLGEFAADIQQEAARLAGSDAATIIGGLSARLLRLATETQAVGGSLAAAVLRSRSDDRKELATNATRSLQPQLN